jgi:hypothetical protein
MPAAGQRRYEQLTPAHGPDNGKSASCVFAFHDGKARPASPLPALPLGRSEVLEGGTTSASTVKFKPAGTSGVLVNHLSFPPPRGVSGFTPRRDCSEGETWQ